jgi:hypothetical protein
MERCTMPNTQSKQHRPTPITVLAVLAVTIATVGFVSPTATGIEGSGGSAASSSAHRPGDRVLRTIVRVERNFRAFPHSLATNQIVRCPARTKLTGGGTSLIGQPSRPNAAPIVYTNGPVGDILPGEEQSWASEVANRSDEVFRYRQFALCATTRSIPFDD